MAKIKAVIFDLDGVISDTQIEHFRVDMKILSELGFNFSLEKLKKYAGVADSEFYKKLLKLKNGKEPSLKEVKKILDKKYGILLKRLEGKIRPIEGVTDLIKKLKKNSFKLAVASSSTKRAIDFTLSEFKIRDYFKVILSQEDVKFSKPNPEIFLKAAKLLNEAPENCLVIEDAPAGIKAAKAAKMKCLAITTNFKKGFLKEADKVINSFNEISIEEIKKL